MKFSTINKNVIIVLVLLALVGLGALAFLQQNKRDKAPSPSSLSLAPYVVLQGWKTYEGSIYPGGPQRGGFPSGYAFSYPSEWGIDESGSMPILIIRVDSQKVGTMLINPGGHGGGEPLKTIRRETIEYPSGSVEITELLLPNNRVNGTFWFMGTPNNVKHPVDG